MKNKELSPLQDLIARIEEVIPKDILEKVTTKKILESLKRTQKEFCPDKSLAEIWEQEKLYYKQFAMSAFDSGYAFGSRTKKIKPINIEEIINNMKIGFRSIDDFTKMIDENYDDIEDIARWQLVLNDIMKKVIIRGLELGHIAWDLAADIDEEQQKFIKSNLVEMKDLINRLDIIQERFLLLYRYKYINEELNKEVENG